MEGGNQHYQQGNCQHSNIHKIAQKMEDNNVLKDILTNNSHDQYHVGSTHIIQTCINNIYIMNKIICGMTDSTNVLKQEVIIAK